MINNIDNIKRMCISKHHIAKPARLLHRVIGLFSYPDANSVRDFSFQGGAAHESENRKIQKGARGQ